MELNTELGQRVRHLRRLRGLKMSELAEQIGCSEGFLSKVESGKSTPSLNLLHKIGEALNTNMAQLFGSTEGDGEVVLRQGERPIIEDGDRSGGSIKIERMIAPAPDLFLQGNMHHLAVGAESEGEITHYGEEFGYVLDGEVALTVSGRSYVLRPGDCFHFKSDRPHAYRNAGAEPARIIWINTPPTY